MVWFLYYKIIGPGQLIARIWLPLFILFIVLAPCLHLPSPRLVHSKLTQRVVISLAPTSLIPSPRLQYSKHTQRVAAFHAQVPKLSQKLLNSCTFPLSPYPKSETPKDWIFDPLSPPLLPAKKLCLASYYIQFSTNIKMYNHTIKTSFFSPCLRHLGAKKLVLIL